MNPINTLISDFDGTIIIQDIGLEFRKWMLIKKEFGYFRILISLFFLPINYFFIFLFSRGSLFSAWSILRSNEDKNKLMKRFISEKLQDLKINNSVLDLIENYDGHKIILSGSEAELISLFLDAKGINFIDDVYGAEVGYLGCVFLNQPRGKSKCKYGMSDVAIGNHYSDRFFMNQSNTKYIISGDNKIMKYAKIRGWNLLEDI